VLHGLRGKAGWLRHPLRGAEERVRDAGADGHPGRFPQPQGGAGLRRVPPHRAWPESVHGARAVSGDAEVQGPGTPGLHRRAGRAVYRRDPLVLRWRRRQRVRRRRCGQAIGGAEDPIPLRHRGHLEKVIEVKPRLAVVMGDPTGIGPEILARALARAEVTAAFTPVVVGDARIVARGAALAGTAVPPAIEIVDLAHCPPEDVALGAALPRAGRAAGRRSSARSPWRPAATSSVCATSRCTSAAATSSVCATSRCTSARCTTGATRSRTSCACSLTGRAARTSARSTRWSACGPRG